MKTIWKKMSVVLVGWGLIYHSMSLSPSVRQAKIKSDGHLLQLNQFCCPIFYGWMRVVPSSPSLFWALEAQRLEVIRKFIWAHLWNEKHLMKTKKTYAELSVLLSRSRGQSYKTFFKFGKIYKPFLKRDNTIWLRKYLVRLLGCCALMYSWSSFFLWGPISNLGTLFYTALRLNKEF